MAGFTRQRRFFGHSRLEQLGDAEVEQLGLALRSDEDVRRFQVAVHHQLGMGVRHRLHHLAEQLQALAYAWHSARCPHIDAFAFDDLQRQPRLPVGGHAGVVEARDVGCDSAASISRSRASLSTKSGVPPGAVRQLQRNGARGQHIGALGQPHRGHAAVAQLTDQPIGADPLRHRRRRCERAGLDLRQPVRQDAAFGHGPGGRAAVASGLHLQAPGCATSLRVFSRGRSAPGPASHASEASAPVRSNGAANSKSRIERGIAACSVHRPAEQPCRFTASAPRQGTSGPVTNRAARCAR